MNNVPKCVNVEISGNIIKRVKSTKYLGEIFDQHLRWDCHVERILKRTRYLLYVFEKLKSIICEKVMITIYYGLFISISIYGIIAWGSAYDNVLKMLSKMQVYCKLCKM